MTRSPFAHWEDAAKPRDEADRPTHTPRIERAGLPPFFQFSQNSLQDYADCPRRFQLRYRLRQKWPAPHSQPIEDHERLMAQGAEFHLLVQRHLGGMPVETLRPHDEPLATWWANYLRYPPADLPSGRLLPEVSLSMPLAGQRLMAKFDLLALDPGERAVIVDWKTSLRRPQRGDLARRLQTRVYQTVLAEAGAALFGGPLAPVQITFLYWFAEDPLNPEIFRYDADQHAANLAELAGLIEEITTRDDAIWPLTWDERHCKYCVYRSLCDRGVTAGPLDEMGLSLAEDVDVDFDFDLEDVDEIAF